MDLYRSLSTIAVSPAGSTRAPPATTEVIRANETLLSLEADRSLEAEQLIFMLNQGERLRLSLLTLRRLAHRLVRNEQSNPAADQLRVILDEAGAGGLPIA